jgi:hypothetical protein
MNTYSYADLTSNLLPEHKKELDWFNENKDQTILCSDIPNRKMMNNQKVIHCPRSEDYALSLREIPGSMYESRESFEPFKDSSGGWYSEYAPEKSEDGHLFWTNARLISTSKRLIPVGFMWRTQIRPVTYRIYGTALARYNYELDIFQLYGFNNEGKVKFLTECR